MKSCPSCRRLFANDAGFCPVDGVPLKAATEVSPEPSPDDPRIGQPLGNRYQVRRIVADGGMGRVYEALDTHLERRVAVKVLHTEVARDRVQVERFKREYEISQLLPHEHIVEVFDFLQLTDGTFALAMDFLDGEELRALLKREKTVRPARVVRMLSQVAIGLDQAHQQKLIHRDLKPDNIFLCGTNEGDVVKLLDFGSAKDKSEGAKKLTVMGTTIGSPFYMSPEQAQGLDTLDAPADVWALSAICYESLTGKVPFTGSNGPSILLAILTQEPAPPSRVAQKQGVPYPVPSTVDDVLSEGFAKEPLMRVASVGSLADKLGHAFGLRGSHRDWAYAAEQKLQDHIDAALPDLIKKDKVVKAAASAEADPFGTPEKDPFDEPPRAGPHKDLPPRNAFPLAPAVTGGPSAPGVPARDLEAVVPTGPPIGLIVGAIVFFLMLAMGAVGYFVFIR